MVSIVFAQKSKYISELWHSLLSFLSLVKFLEAVNVEVFFFFPQVSKYVSELFSSNVGLCSLPLNLQGSDSVIKQISIDIKYAFILFFSSGEYLL